MMTSAFPLRGAVARSRSGSLLSSLNAVIAGFALLHGGGATDILLGRDEVSDSSMSLIIWLGLYLWAFVTLFATYGLGWLGAVFRTRKLLLFLVAATFFSYFYSFNPEQTLLRSIHMAGTVLLGFCLGLVLDVQTAMRVMAWVLGIFIFGSIVAAYAAPSFGMHTYDGEYVWRGLHRHKNELGFTACLAAIFFWLRTLAADVHAIWRYHALALASVFVLIMTNSVTSQIALLIALVIVVSLYFVSKLNLPPLTVVLPTFVLLGAILVLVWPELDKSALSSAVNRSPHLSARTQVWDATWAVLKTRPWIGTGYGVLWLAKTGDEDIQIHLMNLGWYSPHAHNEFLQIASELGIPAGICIVLLQLQILGESLLAFTRRASPLTLLIIAIEVAYLVGSFTEARLFVSRNMHGLLFFALPLLLLRSLETDAATRRLARDGEPEAVRPGLLGPKSPQVDICESDSTHF